MTIFYNLPDELIYMICEKLESVVDLVAFSMCSKRLNLICKDVNYTNDIYDIKCEENIDLALAFNKSIKLHLTLSIYVKNYVKNYDKNEALSISIGKLYSLSVYGSDNLTDVSMLGNVHTLKLMYCERITDVSNLDLTGCMNVSDVSNLGNVHTLNLSFCNKIRDISMLGNVKELDLYECDYIRKYF